MVRPFSTSLKVVVLGSSAIRKRCCRAIRRPRLSELAAFAGRWPVIELSKPSEGNLQGQIVCRKDIPAIQREHR